MWKVRIHRLVVEKDFKKIDKKDRILILKTIYKKLTVAPEKYGFLLRTPLKGYWRLRISHYRVVYRIEKNTVKVLVLKVGIRRDDEVYKKILQRIKKT